MIPVTKLGLARIVGAMEYLRYTAKGVESLMWDVSFYMAFIWDAINQDCAVSVVVTEGGKIFPSINENWCGLFG